MISRVENPHPQSFQANRTTAVCSRLQQTTYVRGPKSTRVAKRKSARGLLPLADAKDSSAAINFAAWWRRCLLLAQSGHGALLRIAT